MIIKIMKIKVIMLLAFMGSGCSLSPGMHMSVKDPWIDSDSYIYIEKSDTTIQVIEIASFNHNQSIKTYKVGVGDQLAITVWGLPEIFPILQSNSDQNLRRVDSNGNIFFPYVGIIRASGKTQDELRAELTLKLAEFFNEPQLDLSISNFNSQKVYILGEVMKPSKLNITDRPLSLSDALGLVNGLNNNTSSGGEIFVVRQPNEFNTNHSIYRADLSSPSGFIYTNNFYLMNNDIVYVNAKGTTRWNRVISQFFPFSSFLNSVDNLLED